MTYLDHRLVKAIGMVPFKTTKPNVAPIVYVAIRPFKIYCKVDVRLFSKSYVCEQKKYTCAQ